MDCVIRPSWTVVPNGTGKPLPHFFHACSAVIAGAAPGDGGAHVALMIGIVFVVLTGVDRRESALWVTTQAATRTARATTPIATVFIFIALRPARAPR